MVASGESDLIKSSYTEAQGPCFSVPVNKAKATAFTCGHGGPTVSLLPYTIGRSIPKSTHTEGEDWTPPLDGGMTKSHCRRARGMGGIVAATFGKYNQPQMERERNQAEKIQGQTWHIVAPALTLEQL